MMVEALSEIGTSYVGKAPLDHVIDVLTIVTRRTRHDLGFEACLTSLPFVATAEAPPGTIAFGRTRGDTEKGTLVDFEDGLRTLNGLGWTTSREPATETIRQTGVAVIGPIAVPNRHVPTADRLIAPSLSRFLVLDEIVDDTAVCLDPVLGGLIGISVDELPGEAIVVSAPARPVDARVIASECLRRGAGWRLESSSPPGPNPSLAGLAPHLRSISSGTGLIRLAYCMGALQIYSLRWATALAVLDSGDPRDLGMVDALRDRVVWARHVYEAALDRDLDRLGDHVDGLAAIDAHLTELIQQGGGWS